MLMLLSVHVTSVLFLVRFNNFALTMGLLLELHALTLVARSYALLHDVMSILLWSTECVNTVVVC